METIDLDWHTYSPHWDSWHGKRHLDGLSTENVDRLAAWAENLWIGSRHLALNRLCDGRIRSGMHTPIHRALTPSFSATNS